MSITNIYVYLPCNIKYSLFCIDMNFSTVDQSWIHCKEVLDAK